MPAPACEVCGKLTARYVCQACGKRVCQRCFNMDEETCLNCVSALGPAAEPGPVTREGEALGWGYGLFLTGFLIIFVGMLMMLLGSLLFFPELVSGGLVFFLGPIPIGVGYGPYGTTLVLATAAMLTILIALFLILQRRKLRRLATS